MMDSGSRATLLQWLKCRLKWLNRHNVISGFFVTMLGVWAAFWLAGLGEQRALDRHTEQRLHLAFLESQYNGAAAQEILDTYPQDEGGKIALKRLDSSSARMAFEDTNLLSYLPLYKASLLKSYIDAIATLNQALEMHLGILERTEYESTSVEADIRKNVRSNAANVLAMVSVLQEELGEHFDEDLYDKQEIERLRERVRYLKEAAVERVPVSDEE